MKSEHGKMISLLGRFKKEFKSGNADAELFKQIKEIEENHIYAEEKAIFTFYKKGDKPEALSTILEQHTQLNALSEEISNNLENDKMVKKVEELMDLMKRQVALEDTKFYPKLDKDLSQAEQEEMFKRIQIILGNIGRQVR